MNMMIGPVDEWFVLRCVCRTMYKIRMDYGYSGVGVACSVDGNHEFWYIRI